MVLVTLRVSTSFLGSLMFPPPGAPGGGKMKDPGNDVGSKGPQRELSWHFIRYYASKS